MMSLTFLKFGDISFLIVCFTITIITIPQSYLVNCENSSAGDRDDLANLIVGGFRARIDDFPYQVGMYITGVFRCGGSLIGPFWVLTARHCVKYDKLENIRVFVGADEAIRAQQLPVEQIYYHPVLKNFEILDVALLKLPSPITYGPSVRCIEMIKSDALLVPGIPSVVSGYGDNESKDKKKEYTLRAATVTLLPPKSCRESYDYADPKYFFCAGFPQGLVDTCQGDSGGPLVLDGVLAGVTIRGQGCAVAGKPGVYMKVTSIRPWIDKVLQNQTTVEEQRLCPEARKKIPTAMDVLNKTIHYLIDELNEVRRINRQQQFSDTRN